MLGKVYGYLTVIDEAPARYRWGRRVKYLNCICKCGTAVILRAEQVRNGNTRSCGCLRRELLTIHGLSRSKEYVAWLDMRDRCSRENHRQYKDWGGRGIKVCSQWQDSFKQFYKDVGPRPSSKHTLHRIDNDGDYKPGNVK
jgi:hypothetical protein